MLKLQFTDNRLEPFWITEKAFSIGSDKQNNLTIDDTSIANQHAKIVFRGDVYFLKDLNSEHGTFINGQRITQKMINCGDTLSIGQVQLQVVDPLFEPQKGDPNYWSLIADSSWLSGQEFPIHEHVGTTILVGRGTHCDIVFPGTHLSRSHAEIIVNQEFLTIKDLNSANGTFVNDKKIAQANVYPGDKIRFDVYSFRIFGPGIQLSKSATSFTSVPVEEKESTVEKKQWKVGPTSIGNREELDLYKKNFMPHIAIGVIIALVLSVVIFILVNLI